LDRDEDAARNILGTALKQVGCAPPELLDVESPDGLFESGAVPACLFGLSGTHACLGVWPEGSKGRAEQIQFVGRPTDSARKGDGISKNASGDIDPYLVGLRACQTSQLEPFSHMPQQARVLKRSNH